MHPEEIRTQDNRFGELAVEINDNQYEILKPFADLSLEKLQNEYRNLIVFPKLKRELVNSSLFTLSKSSSANHLNSYNIAGVFKVTNKDAGSVKVEIRSRFDNDDSQPFLMYLLAKAFDCNFLNWKVDTQVGMWELPLILLFPYYLVKALRQGLFKQYKMFQYNAPNFRGTINIPCLIKNNIPFQGSIAYQVREITYDNPVLHLIRHTIGYINNNHPWLFTAINDIEAYKACKAVIETTPSWRMQDSEKVISCNQRPIKHPFYIEYEPLRKICLQILTREGASLYNQNSNTEVEGVVFDVAWLWEKYLAKLLKELNYKHHQFKGQSDGIKVFEKGGYTLYPDFQNEDKKIVLDAKYKKPKESPAREDLHQVLSYMYLTDAKYGGLIYPLPSNEHPKNNLVKLFNKNSCWLNLFFPVPEPHKHMNNRLYLNEMKSVEDNFLKLLEEYH